MCCSDYRLLSSVCLQGEEGPETERIGAIVNRIAQDVVQPLSAAQLAIKGMTPSEFRRQADRRSGGRRG